MQHPTDAPAGSSTRPYLIRAIHAWCSDNGFTPYLAVRVDSSVRVPTEFVRNDEIVLNIDVNATHGLDLGNEFVQFKARFGGVARPIVVPVTHVLAIYARENGQGMAFPAPEATALDDTPLAEAQPDAQDEAPAPARGLRLAPAPSASEPTSDTPPDDEPAGPGAGARPSLKRIK